MSPSGIKLIGDHVAYSFPLTHLNMSRQCTIAHRVGQRMLARERAGDMVQKSDLAGFGPHQIDVTAKPRINDRGSALAGRATEMAAAMALGPYSSIRKRAARRQAKHPSDATLGESRARPCRNRDTSRQRPLCRQPARFSVGSRSRAPDRRCRHKWRAHRRAASVSCS